MPDGGVMSRVPIDMVARTRGGRVQSGARLYVYDRGTTHEVTGYTTESGSTKVTYPLTADVEGRFPAAWYEAGPYDLYSPDDALNPTQPWNAGIYESALPASVVTDSAPHTIGALWTLTTAPQINANGLDGGIDGSGNPQFAAVTWDDKNKALWQLGLHSHGRLLHLGMLTGTEGAANDGFTSALGIGIDYGGVGLLVGNKNTGVGVYVDQESTITSPTAYGLYVVQNSDTGPAQVIEQKAKAVPLWLLAWNGTHNLTGSKLQWWEGESGGTYGYVDSQTGAFVWAKSVTLNAGARIVGTAIIDEGSFRAPTAATAPLTAKAAASQTADIFTAMDSGSNPYFSINKNGYPTFRKKTAPADAELGASMAMVWVDDTIGATKLMIKAKDSGGTVRTGGVALS